MKLKRIILSIIVLAILSVSVFLDVKYLISPGINEINKSNQIVYKKESEKIEERKQFKLNYLDKEKQLNDEYNNNKLEIEKQFEDKKQSIITKYKDKETSLENSANIPMGSDGWFEQQTNIGKQKTVLYEQKNSELTLNNKEKNTELDKLKTKLNSDLDILEEEYENKLKTSNVISTEKHDLMLSGKSKVTTGSIIIVLIIFFLAYIFNKLVKLNNRVKESWSQIDILLKKRSDLIPNYVNIVKGYKEYEGSTLESIIKLRNKADKATNQEEKIKTNKELSINLNKLLVLVEKYPELKANKNFLSLQNELKEIEDNLAYSRSIYNKKVLKYKNALETIPTNIFATIFGYKQIPFFEVEDKDKENINIKF